MWYKVDFDKLQLLLTPVSLRKNVFLAFLSAVCEPLKDIYVRWGLGRDEAIYNLEHNGQVCYLRKVLNDRFDNIERRIEIKDGNQFDRTYVYTRVEERSNFLGKLALYSSSDYADTGVDFIVCVPNKVIEDNPFVIAAVVDVYKQDVKRFKIMGI